MDTYVKLPVWSDEWMFGVTSAKVTSVRTLKNGKRIVYVQIPGRKRRSKFTAEDIEKENK